MELRLIRHATILLSIGATRLLVDPIFSPAGTMPPIDNSSNDRRNPLVDLPLSESELKNVDAVLLTHTHQDHFDGAAAKSLAKDTTIFCQVADEQKLTELGFSQVKSIADCLIWNKARLIRTGGEHGRGIIGKKMGPVSGYVIISAGEPTIYITGDTIWCPTVEEALTRYQPDVVIVFTGAAQFLSGDPITMTAEDVVQVCRKAPAAKIVAVHMETINHCLLTRQALQDYLTQKGLLDQVVIPYDGELLKFSK